MKKVVFVGIGLFFVLLLLFVYQTVLYQDNKLHIVFCDVGQGDSVLIRTPSGKIILFDGGPDARVLSCISSHMPFWQRKIDLLFLSHPHSDHFVGMFEILPKFMITHFVTEKLINDNEVFAAFMQRLAEKQLNVHYVSRGGTYRLSDGVSVSVLGPSKKYLSETSPGGKIGERAEFASLVVKVSYGKFSALLTGDSQARGLQDANPGKITILQVPHHGSKTGLSKDVLASLRPDLAVISVGKNNYGHPNKYILQLLKDQGVLVKRTDLNQDIEIVSDGKGYRVR